MILGSGRNRIERDWENKGGEGAKQRPFLEESARSIEAKRVRKGQRREVTSVTLGGNATRRKEGKVRR